MSANSTLKQALQRLPSSVRYLNGAANRVSFNATLVLTARSFASAASVMDGERQALYASTTSSTTTNSSSSHTSPMTEYLKQMSLGHTAAGPPPKYAPTPAPKLKCGIAEDDLTFKTSSYQRLIHSPYVQHQEHKVTLTCRWHVLPLNDFEKRILQEIVGNRYNPKTNELKLTSEQFGSRIENKRHLTSILDRMVLAAKKLAVEASQINDDSNDSSSSGGGGTVAAQE